MKHEFLDPWKLGHLKLWTTVSLVVTVPLVLFCLLFLLLVAGEGFTLVAFLLVLSLWLLISQTVSLFLIRRLLKDLAPDPPKGPPPQSMNFHMGE